MALVTFDTRLARVVCRVASFLRFVIGKRRAEDLAIWSAYRFTRWRIDGGKWRRGFRVEAP